MTGKPLEELMRELPPDLESEVRDFIEFLLTKRKRRTGKVLRQDWAGSLSKFRPKYTSLELQHQVIGWRDN
jgi:hypothetical protein